MTAAAPAISAAGRKPGTKHEFKAPLFLNQGGMSSACRLSSRHVSGGEVEPIGLAQAARNAGGPADHLEQLIAVGTTWSRLIRDQAPSMLSLLRESAEFPDLQVRTLDLWRQLASGVAEEMAAYAARDDYLDFDVESITQAGLGAITLGALFSDDPERMVRSYFEMAMRGLLTDAGRRSLPAHVQEPRA